MKTLETSPQDWPDSYIITVDLLCQSEIVRDTKMLKDQSLRSTECSKYVGILVTYTEKTWVCIAQMRHFPQWLQARYTQECLFDIFIYTK